VKLLDFVLARLASAPGRVLEVGCGRGDLALALADAGHDVVAIDPQAPAGPIFRRVTLEKFDGPSGFAAVVASRSLHHLETLGAALDTISQLLEPGGHLVVNDFAWERADEPTVEWYYGQRDILAAARGEPDAAPVEPPLVRWRREHGDLHRYDEMRPELDRRFGEQHLSWEPYFHHELAGAVSETLERGLIGAKAIRAIGFRYVGVR
jgi:SAM-dependent methyltransferase